MKKDIRNLPERKQEELNKIIDIAVGFKELDIHMAILYGSYARGDWVEDRYEENGITYEYISDYDLLFVLSKEKYAQNINTTFKLEKLIEQNVETDAPISIIYHGIDYLNEQIREKNYFFIDILKEGRMLYHSAKYQLEKIPEELDMELVIKKASGYYKKWIKSADEFMIDYKNAFNRESWNQASFLLHQAAERYYIMMLLVYTDHRPKTHGLEKLNIRACKYDTDIKEAFLLETDEEKRLFKLLRDAYVESRYSDDYVIIKEELEYLAERVERLRELCVESCEKKIMEFKNMESGE